MNTIRFSHEYPKLHGQTSAELLAVRSLKVDAHTPKELLDYDTTYDGGRYPLRSGEYIQFIFLGNLRIPFCTIRNAYPPSKVRYYRGSVGQVFRIEKPTMRACENCRRFCGFGQMEIDFDTGERMETVQCGAQAFATPNMAEHCGRYQRKEVAHK